MRCCPHYDVNLFALRKSTSRQKLCVSKLAVAAVTEIMSSTKEAKAMSGVTDANALSLVIVTNSPIIKTSTIAQGFTKQINLNPIESPGGIRPKLKGNNKYTIVRISSAGIRKVVMNTKSAILGIPSLNNLKEASKSVVEFVNPCELIVTIGKELDITNNAAEVMAKVRLSFRPNGCERYITFPQATHSAFPPG